MSHLHNRRVGYILSTYVQQIGDLRQRRDNHGIAAKMVKSSSQLMHLLLPLLARIVTWLHLNHMMLGRLWTICIPNHVHKIHIDVSEF